MFDVFAILRNDQNARHQRLIKESRVLSFDTHHLDGDKVLVNVGFSAIAMVEHDIFENPSSQLIPRVLVNYRSVGEARWWFVGLVADLV